MDEKRSWTHPRVFADLWPCLTSGAWHLSHCVVRVTGQPNRCSPSKAFTGVCLWAESEIRLHSTTRKHSDNKFCGHLKMHQPGLVYKGKLYWHTKSLEAELISEMDAVSPQTTLFPFISCFCEKNLSHQEEKQKYKNIKYESQIIKRQENRQLCTKWY